MVRSGGDIRGMGTTTIVFLLGLSAGSILSKLSSSPWGAALHSVTYAGQMRTAAAGGASRNCTVTGTVGGTDGEEIIDESGGKHETEHGQSTGSASSSASVVHLPSLSLRYSVTTGRSNGGGVEPYAAEGAPPSEEDEEGTNEPDGRRHDYYYYYDDDDMNGSPPPAERWLLRDDSEANAPPARNGDDDAAAQQNASSSTAILIPRILNKVYLRSAGGFPEIRNMTPSLRSAHSSWRSHNPNYTLRYYDLHRCRSYLSEHYHPVFLRAFDCLAAYAAKADLFRYAVVYREGGWYSDWMEVCLVPRLLDSLASNGTLWFSCHDNPFNPGCMANSLFGAAPRHPVLEYVLRNALLTVQRETYARHALWSTGPCALGAAARKLRLEDGIDGVRLGSLKSGVFSYPAGTRRKIVLHKCDDCRRSMLGEGHNNYNELYTERRYYCQDAPSLLGTNRRDAERLAGMLENGTGL